MNGELTIMSVSMPPTRHETAWIRRSIARTCSARSRKTRAGRKVRLDEGEDDHLSLKTASNVWVLVSKMCKDLADAKRRDMCVRGDIPAERDDPPERGARVAKRYLYLSEFRRLVECTAIDVTFRMLYALAVYTYARSNELAALTWDDVDLEHGVIHITKSIDRETHEEKSTKSGTTRRIPIEAELRPLIANLHAERKKLHGKHAAHVPWTPVTKTAPSFCAYAFRLRASRGRSSSRATRTANTSPSTTCGRRGSRGVRSEGTTRCASSSVPGIRASPRPKATSGRQRIFGRDSATSSRPFRRRYWANVWAK